MNTNITSQRRPHALKSAAAFCLSSMAAFGQVSPKEGAVEFRGKSYKMIEDSLTWTKAKEKCEQMGGRLAVVLDNETWLFLRNLTGKPVWLGATDAGQEGAWKWTDGSAMTFSAWGANQPDNHKQLEHYLTTFQGRWSDVQDTFPESRGFICEWTAQTSSTASRSTAEKSIPAEAREFNGKRYHLYPEQLSWQAAKAKCESLGGRLAIVPDQATWDFLKSFPLTRAWLGATDEQREGAWKWVDGQPMAYSAWLPGSPDNGANQEHYLIAHTNGWNDIRNAPTNPQNAPTGFFCEWVDTGKGAIVASNPAPSQKPIPSATPALAAKSMVLSPGWDTLHKGGEVTIRDLALSLRSVGTPNANPITSEEIRIYEGIKYLMPLKEAVQSLGLSQKPPTRKKVACPGFPKDALDCVLYDGLFEGRFNRICLVVDAADQIVSVQLIEESPKTVDTSGVELQNTYNFVETRLKSLGALRVFSNTWIQNPRTSEWVKALNPGLMKSPPQLVRVDSWVKNGAKPLEYVRWYAPMPFVDLLQYCIQRNTNGK